IVLDPADRALAGLAASSGRSLFVFGPSGNGKTTLGRLLHDTRVGDLWIPYCINIESHFIRVFDSQCHRPVNVPSEQSHTIDQRWVKIRRPLIVAGGEMTLDSCDLTFSRSLRSYEAPLHMKANGGTFRIDDFRRQRRDPHGLPNPWIMP